MYVDQITGLPEGVVAWRAGEDNPLDVLVKGYTGHTVCNRDGIDSCITVNCRTAVSYGEDVITGTHVNFGFGRGAGCGCYQAECGGNVMIGGYAGYAVAGACHR